MTQALKRVAELAKQIQLNPNIETKEDDLEFLEERLVSIPRYFGSVISHEVVISVSRFRLDPEAYREKCEEMDWKRRLAHESMVSSINHINRLCVIYRVPVVFTIPGLDRELDMCNANDRSIAALCVYGFCKEVFADASDVKDTYTELEIGTELYQYAIGTGNPFHLKTDLEKLINKAKGEY